MNDQRSKRPRSPVWMAFLAVVSTAGPVLAQTAANPSNPIDVISQRLKFRTEPREPADFVKKSRTPDASLDYIPLANPGGAPARPAMTPDEVRAREAELDALRGRHDRLSGRKSAKGPFKSTAANPVAAMPHTVERCMITCRVDSTVDSSITSTVAPSAVTR